MTRSSALAMVFALSSIVGCNSAYSAPLWREDFETVCNGAPCGWAQVAGSPGAVTYVETLPSEHGVEMVGDGVAISRPGGGAVATSSTISTLQAHLVARCDPGASLTIIVSLTNLSGGPPIDVSGTAVLPPTWDGTRTRITTFVPMDSTNAGAQFIGIVAVAIHKERSGVCEIDYLSLADGAVPFRE